jgi:hypothetical protein
VLTTGQFANSPRSAAIRPRRRAHERRDSVIAKIPQPAQKVTVSERRVNLVKDDEPRSRGFFIIQRRCLDLLARKPAVQVCLEWTLPLCTEVNPDSGRHGHLRNAQCQRRHARRNSSEPLDSRLHRFLSPLQSACNKCGPLPLKARSSPRLSLDPAFQGFRPLAIPSRRDDAHDAITCRFECNQNRSRLKITEWDESLD